jgi:hypothetical protein
MPEEFDIKRGYIWTKYTIYYEVKCDRFDPRDVKNGMLAQTAK